QAVLPQVDQFAQPCQQTGVQHAVPGSGLMRLQRHGTERFAKTNNSPVVGVAEANPFGDFALQGRQRSRWRVTALMQCMKAVAQGGQYQQQKKQTRTQCSGAAAYSARTSIVRQLADQHV